MSIFEVSLVYIANSRLASKAVRFNLKTRLSAVAHTLTPGAGQQRQADL